MPADALPPLTGRRFFRSLPLKGATLYSQFTIAASFFLSCLEAFVTHGGEAFVVQEGVGHARRQSSCREAFLMDGGARHEWRCSS